MTDLGTKLAARNALRQTPNARLAGADVDDDDGDDPVCAHTLSLRQTGQPVAAHPPSAARPACVELGTFAEAFARH
jgi:hypothetical protein